jgi:hypothetical protein
MLCIRARAQGVIVVAPDIASELAGPTLDGKCGRQT